jgi:protein transport protein HofC
VEGFVLGLILGLILVPLGGGILAAVDSVVSRRRSPELADSRMAVLVFGAFLLVIGLLPWLGVFVGVAVLVISGEPVLEYVEGVLSVLGTLLFIGTIPLVGAALVWISQLIREARTAEQDARLDKLLGTVSVIGWLWFVLGIVVIAFPFGLIPGVILLIVAFLLNQRRAARQSELLWILTIAVQKKMPLARAAAEFADECGGSYGASVRTLASLLGAGVSLPDALDRVPRILPALDKAAVRVGWEAGSLAQSLREVAVSRTLRKPMWHTVAARLAYVVGLLVVLQAVVGFILYFIMPKFKKIFMDFGVELPPMTLAVLEASDWFVDYFPLVFPLLLNGIVYLLIVKCWVAWRPQFVIQLLFRRVSARILRALAWSVDGGRPLTEGFDTLSRCFPRWDIRHRLAHALAAIDRGVNWHQSLADHGLIRPIEAAALASAERAGNLSWAMRELAENAERRLSYRLQVCLQILFPFVVLLFGGLVFFFVAGIFGPLVKLITELSG